MFTTCNVPPTTEQINTPGSEAVIDPDKVTKYCRCGLPRETPHEYHQCNITNGCKSRWKNLDFVAPDDHLAQLGKAFLGVED